MRVTRSDIIIVVLSASFVVHREQADPLFVPLCAGASLVACALLRWLAGGRRRSPQEHQ